MPWKWNLIFLEYLRLLALSTHQGASPCAHEGGGCAPCLVGPWWLPSTYSSYYKPLPTTNITNQLKPESKLILLPFSIFLLKAPFTKLLWGIVLRYVTPPMVQLVFVLVLYLLQIFAAEVTLFLSLHVKFIWSKVVLMHDISSRHLWK